MSLYTRDVRKYRKMIQKKHEIDDKIRGFMDAFQIIVIYIVN